MVLTIIILLILIAGPVFGAVKSFQSIAESLRIKRTGVLTDGYVERVEEVEHSDGEGGKFIRYKVTVVFQTELGIGIIGSVDKADEYYQPGLRVHVRYERDNPNQFLVNDKTGNVKLGNAIAGFAGSIALIVFVLVLGWFLRKN